MSKSANLYVRVEPEVKENAEVILSRLGIPMSNAVEMFLRQIILRRGIPFNLTLPAMKPIDISELSVDEYHAELEEGYADIEMGKVFPAREALSSLRCELGI